MNIDGLHTQIDDAQYEKLNQSNWIADDTPLHDIANRCIDDCQDMLQGLGKLQEKKGLERISKFLSSLGEEFTLQDLETLFSVLSMKEERKIGRIDDDSSLFSPILVDSLNDEQVVSFYMNPENKDACIACAGSLEAQLCVLRLFEFVSFGQDERKDFMKGKGDLVKYLHGNGVPQDTEEINQCIIAMEIPEFSRSPEVSEKKEEIYDMVIENCEVDDVPHVLAMYQVYLEYVGDCSVDVDGYIDKLGLFQEMLQDEFAQGWDIGTFFARVLSVESSLRKYTKALNIIKTIRLSREYLRKNTLEFGIVAASFCPYIGNCVDIGYGGYKLLEGKNASGEVIHKGDACVQVGFGVVGMCLDIYAPGSSSILKLLKALPKQSGAIHIIGKIGGMVADFIPEIVNIFKKYGNNVLKMAKVLKDFFKDKVYPIMKDSIKNLMGKIPELQAAI